MSWLDIQYLKLIAPRLEKFKEKVINKLWNCRCPLCGDSDKKKNKARGYFFEHKGHLVYKCHNCNISMGFSHFLKDMDPNLHDRYRLEVYKQGVSGTTHVAPEVDVATLIKSMKPVETRKYVPVITDGLKSIDELPKSHPVRKYVEKRMIPEQFWMTLFYAPKFYEWALGHTDKFKKFTDADHPRLIIPWYSEEGVLHTYTARAFGDEVRYYKIVVDSSYQPPFFGMERLDKTKQIYVVEGPLDSLFVPNCIAVGSASLHTYNNPKAIYITDRDVRNKDIMKEVKLLIDRGNRVCLLPDNLPGKDINEFIMNGMTQDEVLDIINKNTFQGLEANLKFNAWKKV